MKILVCMKQVPQKDAPLKLNETGAWIWERLAEEPSLDELATDLSAEFEVDAERAWRDLVELVDELAGEDLVELSQASPTPSDES